MNNKNIKENIDPKRALRYIQAEKSLFGLKEEASFDEFMAEVEAERKALEEKKEVQAAQPVEDIPVTTNLLTRIIKKFKKVGHHEGY